MRTVASGVKGDRSPGRCSIREPQLGWKAPPLTAARVVSAVATRSKGGTVEPWHLLRLHPTSHGDGREGSLLLLPAPLKALRHALPVVLEGVIGPLVVFYLLLVLTGFRGALIAALTWSYLALGRRLLRVNGSRCCCCSVRS